MKRRLTKRMLDAARLLADGMRPPEVAKTLGCAESSVYRWIDDNDVMAEYRKCLRKAQVRAVAKATKVLEAQLDSDAGNGFLAQNAANAILTRGYAAVMGEDKQEVVVKIAGYTPAPGMPQRSEEE